MKVKLTKEIVYTDNGKVVLIYPRQANANTVIVPDKTYVNQCNTIEDAWTDIEHKGLFYSNEEQYEDLESQEYNETLDQLYRPTS